MHRLRRPVRIPVSAIISAAGTPRCWQRSGWREAANDAGRTYLEVRPESRLHGRACQEGGRKCAAAQLSRSPGLLAQVVLSSSPRYRGSTKPGPWSWRWCTRHRALLVRGVLMGRPELPLDPDSGPVQSFAYDLRRLRQEAGSPRYRDLAQRAKYSVSVLSRAASGRELPSLAVTLAYVDACGGNTGQWRDRWQQVTAELRAQAAADGTPASASQVTGPPADPAGPDTGRRRSLPRRLSTAVGAAAVRTWLL